MQNRARAAISAEASTGECSGMISEALSHIAEMEILRTRKRGKNDKAIQAAPGVISRNLLALARLAPGATRKFSTLIEAARGLFGLSSTRGLAMKRGIREGTINKAEYEAFLDKLTGRDLQSEHDGTVRNEAEQLAGLEGFHATDNSPFSLAPISAPAVLSPSATKGEVRKWALQFRGAYLNDESGAEFVVNRDTVSHSVNHQRKDTSAKVAVFAKIEEVIKASKRHGSPQRADGTSFYYTPVTTDLGEGFVRIVTKPIAGKEEVRAYDVKFKKNDPRRATASPDESGLHRLSGAALTLGEAEASVKELWPNDFIDHSEVQGGEFSIAPATMANSLALNAASRIRDPKAKAALFERMLGKLEVLKRDKDELGIAFGKGYKRKAIADPRKRASIRRERNFREATRRAELEDEVWSKHEGILGNEDLAKIKSHPVHSHLANPDSNLHGRLMSRSAAVSRGKDFALELGNGIRSALCLPFVAGVAQARFVAETMETARRWSGYVCTDCRFVFRVPRDHDGKGLVCPSCRMILRIPNSSDQPRPLMIPMKTVPVEIPAELPEMDPKSSNRHRRKKRARQSNEYDWDQSSPVVHRLRRGEKRRMRWMLIGGVGLFALLMGGVLFSLMGGDDPVLKPTEALGKGGMNGEGEKGAQPDRGRSDAEFLADAELLTREFLDARDVETMLELVRNPELAEPRMRGFYGDGRISAPGMSDFNVTKKVVRVNDIADIEVRTRDFEEKRISYVESVDSIKIDWESWVGWSEMTWDEFLDVKPVEGRVFRLNLYPIEYYNFEFSDDNKWKSYRLVSPDGRHSIYGYAESGSALNAQLRPSPDVMSVPMMLSLQFPENPVSPNQVLIEEVVNDGWVMPNSD